MAEESYSVQVAGDPPTAYINTTGGNYFDTWTQPSTYTWTYTSTIYMYQLICPRCNTTNWGEIDKVVQCKGTLPATKGSLKQACKAKLKAIKEKVDFEVPVG